jgi:hypothetical protein
MDGDKYLIILCLDFISDIIILSISATPKSYLSSQPPPDPPSKDWLTWTRASIKIFIPNNSSKIAGIMGINKAEDIQSL